MTFPNSLPKILVIDNDKAIQLSFRLALKDIAEVLGAQSHGEARQAFSNNRDEIKVIVMDKYLLSQDTLDLTAEIRTTGYTGPIVATSDSYDLQMRQLEAGCSHACTKLCIDHVVGQWFKTPAKMEKAWMESGRKIIALMKSNGKTNAGPEPTI